MKSPKIVSILFVLFGLCFSFSSFAQPPIFTMTVLYSNDFHGADMKLLAKRATLIKQIRAESKCPVLLLDDSKDYR
jgi:2',3'-cyclic-nucleotide 2'-phosphodiesterase (5'-nucleotidase family)